MTEEYCPSCGANLQGEPIPEEYREYYGEQTHYSRKIGRYDYDEDRIVEWQCPDCMDIWIRV